MQTRSKWTVLAFAVSLAASNLAAAADPGSAGEPAGRMPASSTMHHGMMGGASDSGGMMGGGMMGGGMMGGGMMGGGMMGMMHGCGAMGNDAGMPQLPPGNEKLQLKMQGEMMQRMGEILVKYADQVTVGKAGSP